MNPTCFSLALLLTTLATARMQLLFQDPNLLSQLAVNPATRDFCLQPDFQAILKELQENPTETLQKYQNDRRLQAVVAFAIQNAVAQSGMAEASGQKAPAEPEPKSDSKDETMKAGKSEPELTPEQQKALEHRSKGNDFYYKRMFDDAIAEYNAARDLEPDNIVYLLNIAGNYVLLFEVAPDCAQSRPI